jgi:hypothetical protein
MNNCFDFALILPELQLISYSEYYKFSLSALFWCDGTVCD